MGLHDEMYQQILLAETKTMMWKGTSISSLNTLRRGLYEAKKKLDVELAVLDDNYKPEVLTITVNSSKLTLRASLTQFRQNITNRAVYIVVNPEES